MKALLLLIALGRAGCSSNGNRGATGAAPARYMGERPNVNGTYDGSAGSSSMRKQRIKQDGAAGA